MVGFCVGEDEGIPVVGKLEGTLVVDMLDMCVMLWVGASVGVSVDTPAGVEMEVGWIEGAVVTVHSKATHLRHSSEPSEVKLLKQQDGHVHLGG